MNLELVKQLENIDNINAEKLASALESKHQQIEKQEDKMRLVEKKAEITLRELDDLEQIAARWLELGDYDDMPDVSRHLSEEHRAKISQSMKGRRIPEEVKQRMRENSRRMTVYQYTLDGKLVKIWKSTRQVMRQLGYNNTSISRCCNGKQRTCHGYIWRYAPIEDPTLVELKITETFVSE